jgi:prophage antirepressor-like protein
MEVVMAASPLSGAVLAFENTQFDVVDVHNVPWLRGGQVVGALGYSDPADSLQKLYSRNADEFTTEMTQVLDLQTAGGVQPVRIFSPRGCYLLGMLARTEKAKAFRAWVLDVLEGRVVPHQPKPMTIPQQIALGNQRMKLLDRLEETTHPEKRRVIHEQLAAVSRMMGLSIPVLEKIGRDIDPDESPWLSIMEQFARELASGRFKGPYKFEGDQEDAVLCVRPSDVMLHLSTAPDLREFWRGLQVKSPRVLKKMLEHAGVVQGEVERTIGEKRYSRLSVMSLAALAAQGVEVRHE